MTSMLRPSAFGTFALLSAVSLTTMGCGRKNDKTLLPKGSAVSANADADSQARDGEFSLSLPDGLLHAKGDILVLELLDAKGKLHSRKATGSETKIAFSDLAYGLAKVTAKVTDSEGRVTMEGAGEAEVIKGKSQALSLKLRPVDQGGGLTIIIDKPDPVDPMPFPKNSLLRLTETKELSVALNSFHFSPTCKNISTEIKFDNMGNADVILTKCHTVVPPSPSMLPSTIRTVNGYRLDKPVLVAKLINILNSLPAQVKPEVVPAIACVSPADESSYLVGRSHPNMKFTPYRATGSPCWWHNSFKVADFYALNTEVEAFARANATSVYVNGSPGVAINQPSQPAVKDVPSQQVSEAPASQPPGMTAPAQSGTVAEPSMPVAK